MTSTLTPAQTPSRTAAARAVAAANRAARGSTRKRSAAPASTPAPALERLYTLKELGAAGYGSRGMLTRLIHEGTLPAVRVGNAFKIRASDLHLIAAPVDPATLGESAV